MPAKNQKEYMKQWHLNNKDKEKEYRASKKEQTAKTGKKWHEENKDYVKLKRKKRYAENKKAEKEYGKNYRKNNPGKQENYNKLNQDKLREYHKQYRQLNKKKVTERKKKSHHKRLKIDPVYKLSKKIRNLIGMSFKNSGFTKKSSTFKILGCTFKEFKIHLKNQFESWMSWDNYGAYKTDGPRTWNIDHIIPLATAKTENEIVKLNHYTNLRPLCSKENLDKWKNIIE